MMKERFSVEEHVNTGEKLKAITVSLTQISNDIYKKYPKQHSITKQISKINAQILRLRSTLEDDMFINHSELPNYYVNVYFNCGKDFKKNYLTKG